jgi:hypothetical protein
VYPAGVLVPDGVWQFDAGLVFPLTFEDVQIGAAHTGATDAYDHVQGLFDRGFGDVGEL